jgi:uncharacterized protein
MPDPLPGEQHLTALTAAYWEGLHAGRLVLQRCSACGRWQHYPRRLCRGCWSETMEFAAVDGRGTVFAAALSHRTPKPELRDQLPIPLGLVTLDEGPALLARLEPGLGAGDRVAFDPDATLRDRVLSFAGADQPSE